tara:strand:+ start:447 stop:794 length:348 start_codon:yes stop_codon:yes gene_type:complete
MLISYFYSLCAALLIGIQHFLISYLNHIPKNALFFIIIFIILFFIILSRILIYYASKTLDITLIHPILISSILVTALLSILVYKTEINIFMFFVGLFLLIMGINILHLSVIVTNI